MDFPHHLSPPSSSAVFPAGIFQPMISLSSVESKLPPGFRFHPRDEELICDYLMNWVAGDAAHAFPLLIEVDLNKCEPWDIPKIACVGTKEWYFYSQRDRKYATGLRTNRATGSGYWKATGKDRAVVRKGSLVGMRKTLVFYQGRAPKGRKTDWVMHEFRLQGSAVAPPPMDTTPHKEDWVLCRVFFKTRLDISDTTSRYGPPQQPSSPPMDRFAFLDHPQAPQQVPCFSISPNPNSSVFTGGGGGGTFFMSEFGNYGSSFSTVDPSTRNKNRINDVLNRITKVETSFNQVGVYGSPPLSIGDGSSDSYISEGGMFHTWNQY
ncbi:hypothetical protein M569_12214 [Genlisea aurea]|uniref:NAC domain-containing protein n=1 Tax=Genlisea aurea TaxID=192259 RepID=S8DRY3_9LAMI|nr:hypothetical protein M569_12214 [Genlisea aurea]